MSLIHWWNYTEDQWLNPTKVSQILIKLIHFHSRDAFEHVVWKMAAILLQTWSRQWIRIRQQVIIWSSVEQYRWRHKTSLGPNVIPKPRCTPFGHRLGHYVLIYLAICEGSFQQPVLRLRVDLWLTQIMTAWLWTVAWFYMIWIVIHIYGHNWFWQYKGYVLRTSITDRRVPKIRIWYSVQFKVYSENMYYSVSYVWTNSKRYNARCTNSNKRRHSFAETLFIVRWNNRPWVHKLFGDTVHC